MYWYNEPQTLHTTYRDGLEIYEFASGQYEKHFPDGSHEIIFADKTKKLIFSDGQVR